MSRARAAPAEGVPRAYPFSRHFIPHEPLLFPRGRIAGGKASLCTLFRRYVPSDERVIGQETRNEMQRQRFSLARRVGTCGRREKVSTCRGDSSDRRRRYCDRYCEKLRKGGVNDKCFFGERARLRRDVSVLTERAIAQVRPVYNASALNPAPVSLSGPGRETRLCRNFGVATPLTSVEQGSTLGAQSNDGNRNSEV